MLKHLLLFININIVADYCSYILYIINLKIPKEPVANFFPLGCKCNVKIVAFFFLSSVCVTQSGLSIIILFLYEQFLLFD